jgi:ppGpp synthetase/RelA/SpoT-type nucleotidyltranferase
LSKPLSKKARHFFERYEIAFDDLVEAAQKVEEKAHDILLPYNFDLHLVTARAKDPDSLLRKIRSKGYGDPARQLTDQVGLRVITYYESDVDRVALVLRNAFEIDEKRSEDKRVSLGLTKFGYRSVHLIARAFDASDWSPLKNKWFEIQVRSVLEHAWAEIEHELVYKAGIKYPLPVLRQFAALAGAAEVLDQQFTVLRDERSQLIDHYRDVYSRGEEPDEPFDAARLLGYLEATRPEGLSWRTAEVREEPFPPRIEATCVEALEACDVATARQLHAVLKAKPFLAASGDFASSEGISRAEISHLAIVVLVVGSLDEQLFKDEFLDMRPTVETYVPTLATAA